MLTSTWRVVFPVLLRRGQKLVGNSDSILVVEKKGNRISVWIGTQHLSKLKAREIMIRPLSGSAWIEFTGKGRTRVDCVPEARKSTFQEKRERRCQDS